MDQLDSIRVGLSVKDAQCQVQGHGVPCSPVESDELGP